MEKKYSKWIYGILSICYIITFSSCTKNSFVNDFQNIIEPDSNSEISHTISINEAELQLVELLTDIEGIATRNGAVFAPRKIVSRYTTGTPASTKKEGKIEPYVHVFNFKNKKGFAIMSGDDRVNSLLALTFNGELTPETEVDNPGIIIFLTNMEQKFEDKIEGLADTLNVVYSKWKTSYYGMYGVNCNVQWGQKYPYNIYCPIKNNSPTLTCCVATAVAQLMSAYEYPARYGKYKFDWSEMNKHINTSHKYIPAYNQIARLMQQLGLSKNLNIEYGLSEGGSGANSANIPRTLKNFGFSNGGTLKEYNTNTIVSELLQGYPILIGGCESCTVHKKKFLGITVKKYYTYSGGHRWLAHGLLQRVRRVSIYNKNNVLISEKKESVYYPLCNFGWNGIGDGYYLSNAFNTNKGPAYNWNGPYTRSTTENKNIPNYFQYKITAVTGIRK